MLTQNAAVGAGLVFRRLELVKVKASDGVVRTGMLQVTTRVSPPTPPSNLA
jgi:hypothetical protein